MITERNKERIVKLISNGQDTVPKLIEAGMDEADIKTLSSPGNSEHVAVRNGDYLTLSRAGEDLLYKLEKDELAENHAKIMRIATIAASVGAIVSALLLGIQTISHW